MCVCVCVEKFMSLIMIACMNTEMKLCFSLLVAGHCIMNVVASHTPLHSFPFDDYKAYIVFPPFHDWIGSNSARGERAHLSVG